MAPLELPVLGKAAPRILLCHCPAAVAAQAARTAAALPEPRGLRAEGGREHMPQAASSASPFREDNLCHLQEILEAFNPAVEQNEAVIAF